jgi:hypothetical protein
MIVIVCLIALHSYFIDAFCQRNPLCQLNVSLSTITCEDTSNVHDDELTRLPLLSCLIPVNNYIFRHFRRIHSHTFDNMTFPSNQSVTIQFVNVTLIEQETFSKRIALPTSSYLFIDIEHNNSSSTITLEMNAFVGIHITRLRFINIDKFNGRSTFDTDSFGNELDIDELIYDRCGVTGFIGTMRNDVKVNRFLIVNSSSLTQITDRSLPTFLSTTKSLTIFNTSLQMIAAHTFQAWSLNLEELILIENSKLNIFPSQLVDGVLMKLTKLDLSDNAIRIIDNKYDWFPYSYAKHLLLRRHPLNVILKTNILRILSNLETIDLSNSYIDDNSSSIIDDYFPPMKYLQSIDVSHANLTELMIIDLLTRISNKTEHHIDIQLAGHRLTDRHICSYMKIVKQAPNLLRLHLDRSHECNCIVELFFAEQTIEQHMNNTFMVLPSCVHNRTRSRCNIQTQIIQGKCNFGEQSTDLSTSDNTVGHYAFGGIIAGIAVLVVILLSFGFRAVYRRRRHTILDMEQPIENPLTTVIEQRLHCTS